MAEVNRKSVTSLIRAYGDVNPEAVVRLMSQYADIQEKKAAEEAEETKAQYDMIGQIGSGAMENLQDFRTAKAGGYEGGFFKFLIEKPENIADVMTKGQEAINSATGREKELMTALFPKAKQKHFDRIDKKAEKYGVSGEEWQNMTFKERRKLKKDFENNKEIDKVVESDVKSNNEEILFHDDATPPEVDYTDLSYNKNQAQVAQSYIDKDWLPDSNVNKDAYLALGGKHEPTGGWDGDLNTDTDTKITDDINSDTSDILNNNNLDSTNVLSLKNNTNFKIDEIKLDEPTGFNANNSDSTSMFNNFDDIKLSSDMPDSISTFKLDETYGPKNDILSEDIKDLKIGNDNIAGGIMSGIKSLFGFG